MQLKTENEEIRKQYIYTKGTLYCGFWQREYKLENMLKSYTTTTCEALKAEIKFIKEVLFQKVEANELRYVVQCVLLCKMCHFHLTFDIKAGLFDANVSCNAKGSLFPSHFPKCVILFVAPLV